MPIKCCTTHPFRRRHGRGHGRCQCRRYGRPERSFVHPQLWYARRSELCARGGRDSQTMTWRRRYQKSSRLGRRGIDHTSSSHVGPEQEPCHTALAPHIAHLRLARLHQSLRSRLRRGLNAGMQRQAVWPESPHSKHEHVFQRYSRSFSFASFVGGDEDGPGFRDCV